MYSIWTLQSHVAMHHIVHLAQSVKYCFMAATATCGNKASVAPKCESVHGAQDDLMTHCVTKWIFTANMVVDLDELKRVYLNSWQSLPTGSLLTSSQ